MAIRKPEGPCADAHQDIWTKYLKSQITNIQGVSPRDHPDVVQFARQKIDEEVAVLLAAVSSLRTRRNALSHISTLPSEVLGRILHFHAAKDPPSDAKNLGWIQATHVCRFWRDTALQHPSLWSDMTDRLGRNWMKEMVVRAKLAPLSYSQSSYRSSGPPGHTIAGYVIPQQLSRIRHLSIGDSTGSMGAILQSTTSSPAPILESLHLRDGRGECVLPNDIFNSHFPVLRRLELRGIRLSWFAPILRGIVNLHIENNQYNSNNRSSRDVTAFTQFFIALQEMPSLETLFLSHCLPAEPRNPPSIPRVILPRVHKLTLGGSFTVECKTVLKHLAVLPSCDIMIECGQLDSRHFPGIMTFAKAHAFSGTHEKPFLTMLLSNAQGSDSYARWHLRFWAAGDSPNLAGHRREGEGVPAISILIDTNDDTDVQDVCHGLTKDAWAIRDLIVESDILCWSLTPEDWISVFERYTEVENLSARGQVARSLCGALGMPTLYSVRDQQDQDDDGGQLMQEQPFFRKLRRVEFKCVDFIKEYEEELSDDDGDYTTITANAFDMLKASLARRRAAADTPLTLLLRGCTVTSDQVRELKEIVETVDWDLFEGISKEPSEADWTYYLSL